MISMGWMSSHILETLYQLTKVKIKCVSFCIITGRSRHIAIIQLLKRLLKQNGHNLKQN